MLDKVWAQWRRSGPDAVCKVSAGGCSLVYCLSDSGYVLGKRYHRSLRKHMGAGVTVTVTVTRPGR